MNVDHALKLDMAYNCLLRQIAGLGRSISREEYDNAYDIFYKMIWSEFEWLDSCIHTAEVETDSYFGIRYRVYEKFDRITLATALCSIFPSSNCLEWRRRPDKKYSKEEKLRHLGYLESLLNCNIEEAKKDYAEESEYKNTHKNTIENSNKILNILFLIERQLKESNE